MTEQTKREQAVEKRVNKIVGLIHSNRCADCEYLSNCHWLKEGHWCLGKQEEVAHKIVIKLVGLK
jgi:hypothetical protein